MRYDFSGVMCKAEEEEDSLEGHIVPKRSTFSYLGLMIQSECGIDDDVSHGIILCG